MRTIIPHVTITEWILILAGAAFVFAPVAAPMLRPVQDREAILRDITKVMPVPQPNASRRLASPCRSRSRSRQGAKHVHGEDAGAIEEGRATVVLGRGRGRRPASLFCGAHALG
jgi:hypothetical protein